MLKGVNLEIPTGRFPGADGAVRLRQDDAAEPDRRARRADGAAAWRSAACAIGRLSGGELSRWRSRNIGFVFQLYNLLPVLTAAKNVELPLLLTKLSARASGGSASTSRSRSSASRDRARHYPRQLSGGQEQRVGIARAIVTDPTLLLCDEPTGDLDRKAGDEILDLLQALNRDHGKTIVMVTHDPHAAERAQRTLHLDKGVLTNGEPAREVPPARLEEHLAAEDPDDLHAARRSSSRSCCSAADDGPDGVHVRRGHRRRRSARADPQGQPHHAAAGVVRAAARGGARRRDWRRTTPGSAASTRIPSNFFANIARGAGAVPEGVPGVQAPARSDEGLARRSAGRHRRQGSRGAVRLEARRPGAAQGHDLAAEGRRPDVGVQHPRASTTAATASTRRSSSSATTTWTRTAAAGQGLVGWYIVKIDDPAKAVTMSQTFDEMFANSSAETKTTTEKGLRRGLRQADRRHRRHHGRDPRRPSSSRCCSIAASTMAQSVRERTNELAVLKTRRLLGRHGAGARPGRVAVHRPRRRRHRSRRWPGSSSRAAIRRAACCRSSCCRRATSRRSASG